MKTFLIFAKTQIWLFLRLILRFSRTDLQFLPKNRKIPTFEKTCNFENLIFWIQFDGKSSMILNFSICRKVNEFWMFVTKSNYFKNFGTKIQLFDAFLDENFKKIHQFWREMSECKVLKNWIFGLLKKSHVEKDLKV